MKFWKKEFAVREICSIIEAGAKSQAIEINLTGLQIKYKQPKAEPLSATVPFSSDKDPKPKTEYKNLVLTQNEIDELQLTNPKAFEDFMISQSDS